MDSNNYKDFRREWRAICPRCDKELTYEEFACENCGKGKIKVAELTEGVRRLFFGCEKCGKSYSHVKCKCGAELPEKVIKTSLRQKVTSSLIGWAGAIAIFGIPIFLAVKCSS